MIRNPQFEEQIFDPPIPESPLPAFETVPRDDYGGGRDSWYTYEEAIAKFPDLQKPLNGRCFTYAYIHPHRLALPIADDGIEINFAGLTDEGDAQGFAREPARQDVIIPAGKILYRYLQGSLWVYRTTKHINGRAAPLNPYPGDRNSSEGGGIQIYIADVHNRRFLDRRPALHADYEPDWREASVADH